jgi:hypothetical protein
MTGNAGRANLRPPFEKGNMMNPGGRPVGARNRVTAKFLEALADDFEEHGKAALVAMRETEPARYINAIVQLCPKEVTVDRPLSQLSDDELAAAVEMVRDALARQAPLDWPPATGPHGTA